MAKSHALVDLTLDSEDEGRTKAGSKTTQRAREGLPSTRDRGPQSQDYEKSQRRDSPSLYKAESRVRGSKHRTSINTRETAFDLTADDDKPSRLTGETPERANPSDPRMQRAAGASVEEDMTPTRQDVYEFESVGQRERSKSGKRRTTPLTKASPAQGDSGRSVAFRPSPHVSRIILKYGRSKGSERDGEDPTHKAYAKITSQKSSPGPGLVPSLSTVNQSSDKKFGRRSRDAHGELSPNPLRAIDSAQKPAAEVLSKRGSPARGPTSKKSKRTMNSKKPPSGDVVSHEPPQPTAPVATTGPEKPRGVTLSAVKEQTANLCASAAVQDNTELQVLRASSLLVHQQERKDEQAGSGSPTKEGPEVPMIETLDIDNPMNRAASTKVSRSASCTGNGTTESTGEASIPPHNKKMTVKDERAERTTSSLRLDRARGASPTPQASEISADTKESSGIPSEVVAHGMKTMAAAMVAEQTLRSNIQGGFVTEPAIDLLSTVSESQMEQCMRRHLKVLHDNHEYFMKAWLGRARKACDRRATAKRLPSSGSGLDHAAGSMTVPEQYVQSKSPFDEMKPLGAPVSVKESQVLSPTGRLQQQILRLPKPIRPVEEVPVTMYTSEAVSVPPYLNYIPIRRNILAENDRSLKYYPYFGEDGPGKKSGLEKELEERFNNRIRHLPLRHWYAEQADKLMPYTTRYLEQLGCSIEAVLYLLLDTDHSMEPAEGSSGALHKWYARCFATDSVRTSKKWQNLFSSMTPPGQQALARAELACKAFYTVTKLSLWYIVKTHEVTVSLLAQLQENKITPSATQGLSTYTDLGCLMCHVHDCPCHGEYEEFSAEKDTDGRFSALKDDSNPEDADSDSDNGMTHNLRKRVVAEPRVLRSYRIQLEPVAYNDNDVESIQEFLGMDDDGTISGIWNRTGDRGNPGFPDTELCSPQCFWKKSNRTAKAVEWSEKQLEFLRTLLPAYIASRRGPCMMAYAFDKPCQEVFNMMRFVSSGGPPGDEMPTTLPHTGNGRSFPRRGWQYWQKHSVTHIHEERNPFRPCSHEGSCQDAACPCYKANITCEKSCQCANSCERRFRGCNCAQGNQVCWMSERCDCYQLNRECDPDLCGSCGACEVLDPVNRYNEKITHRKCSNVYMQRGVPKRTLMGHSDIQGWGLYIGEDVKANEFLGEYKGEIVSKTEGDRRGAVYHYRGIEYLFGLNKTQEIDSTRAGNKMRFINNSKKHINCYPRKVLCNTVQRIGMYAKRDLVSGEELYFDYGYPEAVTKNFWDKGEPKMPTGGAGAAAANTKKGKTTVVKQGEVSSASVAKAEKEKGEAKRKGGRPPKHGGARSGAGRKARAIKASSAPSGKRAGTESQGGESSRDGVTYLAGESSRGVAADLAAEEVEEMDVIESDGDGDGDDDVASEVDPYALEESESEEDSYASAGEVDVEVGRAKGKGPRSKVNRRLGGSAQKRGWITRKENLKRKRGY